MTRQLEIMRLAYQAERRSTEEELSAWETHAGVKLPDDYRRFLSAWNGGTVSPYVFSQQHPDAGPDQDQLVLEVLSDWDDVLDDSQFDEDPTIRSVPPLHLVIGTDPRDVYLLLSLEPETYGRIRTWYKNYNQTWGEPENNQVGEVTESFNAFLDGLTDGGSDFYHASWSRLDPTDNPQELRF